MSDNDGGDFGSFLAGFVIGGLVGTAVALVLAPQSGADTRSQITGKDAGEERYYSAVESAETYAQRVGERASQFSQDAEEQARIVLDAGREGPSTADDNGSATLVDDGDDR